MEPAAWSGKAVAAPATCTPGSARSRAATGRSERDRRVAAADDVGVGGDDDGDRHDGDEDEDGGSDDYSGGDDDNDDGSGYSDDDSGGVRRHRGGTGTDGGGNGWHGASVHDSDDGIDLLPSEPMGLEFRV